ncbi:hypothetical protein QK289_15580 [Exiguobacterium antarcticum]|uniref:Uncharacterized protein n=1 Tax=Exiguobacterium antarcticum TaxID=132920 RepID=A0ABT6R656_9BACL|nr:hypothetical protein [Exiguobacterium antarcticum]MDI3236436.1 hypothetical protein [Exiguobacterium antarcticum]
MPGFKIIQDHLHRKMSQSFQTSLRTLEGQTLGNYENGQFKARLYGGEDELFFEILMDNDPTNSYEKEAYEPLEVMAKSFDVNEMYIWNQTVKNYVLL